MGDTESHVASWRAAGLIDEATVARIASWEADRARRHETDRRPNLAAIFGPGVSIGEMFAYLGVAFLLAATDVFLGRSASSPEGDMILAVGSGIQAVILFAVGLTLLRGDARRRRAAGVAFLVATGHAGAAAAFGAQAVGVEGVTVAVIGSVVALLVATLARRVHPALTTQVAMLGALTCLSISLLTLAQEVIFGPASFSGADPERASQEILITIGSAAWWLITGLVIGLIGLYESRNEGVVGGAAHRAGLTRLWAGLVAIGGFCSAVTRSAPLPNGEYGRVLEPWMAEVAILVVSAILIERAFRRESAAFVVAGAVGMIVALTDFNFSYLSDRTEIGLLIEGLILLAVGFFTDRIRRRLGRRGVDVDRVPPPTTSPLSDQPVPAGAPGE